MAKQDKDSRVFVKDGRRHFRRRYSLTEPRIGLVILVILAAIVGWVAWKGAHPDPALFAAPIMEDPGSGPPSAPADRGPLPDALALEGWTENSISVFDPSNLYVKINGREDYYKSFGFEKLHFASIVHEEDAATVVDIEMFDLGEARNALGAYAGERSPDILPEATSGGMTHFDRNALYLTRGRYYVRAIGSDESPRVRAELDHLRARFEAELEGEPLPWAYALFVGQLGLDPGRVSYAAENAFSFGFAREVYSALLPDDETELFVVRSADPAAAADLAARFAEGFAEYGSPVEGPGHRWIQDRYIRTIAGAVAEGAWVIGVRGAPDVATAEAELARLSESLSGLRVDSEEGLHEAAAPVEY